MTREAPSRAQYGVHDGGAHLKERLKGRLKGALRGTLRGALRGAVRGGFKGPLGGTLRGALRDLVLLSPPDKLSNCRKASTQRDSQQKTYALDCDHAFCKKSAAAL